MSEDLEEGIGCRMCEKTGPIVAQRVPASRKHSRTVRISAASRACDMGTLRVTEGRVATACQAGGR